MTSRPDPDWPLPTVLIADDDRAFLRTLSTLLEASGYTTVTAESLVEATDRFPRAHPDLVIVDLHMPGGGMRLVESLAGHSTVPVMVLSGDHDEAVKVQALDAGAEDFVTKPFAAAELLARVRVMLRRGGRTGAEIVAGRLTLLPASLSVRGPAGSAELTPTEFELLRALARAEGFVTTGDLLAEVWGPAYSREQEYVRAYVRRIRGKLAGIGLGDAIDSRPGSGYRLVTDTPG